MQTDLLRRDLRRKPLVPNNERRFYTSEKDHWLRHTLPKLESALREAGAESVLVATMEITMQRYNPRFKNSLSNSISAAQLYEMPAELGYHTATLDINFLRGNTLQGKYWIKPLKNAKGMKNIISYQYGKIDDEIVFEAINEELEKDVRYFIENIKKRMK